jgi:hypothetical protein
MSWNEDLIDDVRALIVAQLDWASAHLLALTGKEPRALVERLKKERGLFGPGVPLATPHGALHPLSLLAHGHTCLDPAVRARRWQWEDIEDLAQFPCCHVYIRPLLAEHPANGKTLRPYRATLGNMSALKDHLGWHDSFSGTKAIREIARVGNVKLLQHFMEEKRYLRAHLLQEVFLSGNFSTFYSLWNVDDVNASALWTREFLREIGNTGSRDLLKEVRAMGFGVYPTIEAAIRAGDMDLLREALLDPNGRLRGASESLSLVKACELGHSDMAALLLEFGVEWPNFSWIPPTAVPACLNCGYNPFVNEDDSYEVARNLDYLRRTNKLDAWLQKLILPVRTVFLQLLYGAAPPKENKPVV